MASNPNSMRAAIIKCLDAHKEEMSEKDYNYAKLQFMRCKPNAVYGMATAFITRIPMDANRENESLNEEGSVFTISDDLFDEISTLAPIAFLEEDKHVCLECGKEICECDKKVASKKLQEKLQIRLTYERFSYIMYIIGIDMRNRR